MTVSTTTNTVTFLGNGATTSFSFSFIGVSSSDITVTLTDTTTGVQTVLSPSDYTLVLNPAATGSLWGIGGTVTYPLVGSPIPNGIELTIARNVPLQQNISISNQGAFYPQSVEQGLDLLEMQIQETATDNDYAVKAPTTDPTPPSNMPPAALRAGKVLGFDATGLVPMMYTPTGVTPPSPVTLQRVSVTSTSSPYTVPAGANVINVNASGGNVVINFPTMTTVAAVYVVRTDNVYNHTVTLISNSGSGTINGASSYVLQFQNQGIMMISTIGSAWNAYGQIKPTTDPLTPNYKGFNNIFNLINDPYLIQQIQAGTAGYLDTYFTQLNAVGGKWILPNGYYHLAQTVNMTPGVELVGAGQQYSDTPSLVGTAIYLGGNPGEWGMQQSNPNSIASFEAYKVSDINFQVTQNGLRWNRLNGGFTDDNTSQGYMLSPRIERCNVSMDGAPGTNIGVQMSKCFDFVIEDCRFNTFYNSIDMEGSDIGRINGCRFDTDTNYSILANSHASFGSSLRISNNDFNDPYGFVYTTYLDTMIDFNHMEFDRDRTRTTAAIVVDGNAFHTKIHDNRIQPGALVASWLTVTNDVNRFLVSVKNNTTSAPTQMGNVNYGQQYYFSNGGTRALVIHSANSAGDQQFPMNWVDGLAYLPNGTAAVVTPSTAGVDGGASHLNPICSAGAFTIFPNASPTIYMQISDWGAYGLPANVLKGTLTIKVTTAAGAAGQQGKWSVHDNSGTPLASGTITHAVANQMYTTTLVTSQAFATNCWVRYWNEDTGHGERFYVYSTQFLIG